MQGADLTNDTVNIENIENNIYIFKDQITLSGVSCVSDDD